MILNKLKENFGLVLFSANIVLLLSTFVAYDPFGFFEGGYENASRLLDATQENTDQIEIIDSVSKTKVVLKKGPELAETVAEEEGDEDASMFASLKPKNKGKVYQWTAVVTIDSSTQEYSADNERVAAIFDTIGKMRSYYAIERTSEKDNEYELGLGANGAQQGIELKIQGSNSGTIYVGRTNPRGDEAYVRLDNDDEIFLVQTNPKRVIGLGKKDFFKNRKIMPANLTKDRIIEVIANFGNTNRNVRLAKTGGQFEMISPAEAKVAPFEVNNLLQEIADLKASNFLEAIPEGIDTTKSFHLEILYKVNLTDPLTFTLDILGQRDYSTYVVRDKAGNLFELSSIAFDNFYNPEKLVDRGGSKNFSH